MEKINLDNILRQLKRFRERLTNFSRRNRELYFKTHALSLNLTRNPYAAFIADEKNGDLFKDFAGINISSYTLESLIKSSKLDLNGFFLFDAKPTSDLFWGVRSGATFMALKRDCHVFPTFMALIPF